MSSQPIAWSWAVTSTRAAILGLAVSLVAACGGAISTGQLSTVSPTAVATASPTDTPATTSPPLTASATATAGVTGRILVLRFPASGSPTHFVVNTDGSDETPFGPQIEYEARQVSVDGSLLAIVGPNSQGIIVGGTITLADESYVLFENPEPNLNLACGIWAPNDRLACEGWNDDDPSVAGIQTVLAADGSDPQRLTTGRDVPCDYSPDGSQLAFLREGSDGNGSTLMVMDSDGGEPEDLLEHVAGSGLPCDFAPDGSSILVATTDGELKVVTLDGDATTFVGDGLDGFVFNGLWSVDGSRILLTMAFQGEQGDVYTVAADGSDVQRITTSDALDEGINWLP